MNNSANKRVIVTADDFGLSREINDGIVQGYLNGLVRSTALLMNAPATDHAISLARKHPGLEVGIHLGLVEGICLSATGEGSSDKSNSIRDDVSYFNARPCLLRSWKKFGMRYLSGGIRFTALKHELDMQLSLFQKELGQIPFANSTQHLHLLPGISEIVLDLASAYGIRAFRCHAEIPDAPQVGQQRWASARVMRILGKRFRALAEAKSIRMPDGMFGFAHSGHLDIADMVEILSMVQEGTYEIMTHPGFDCPQLKLDLPWAFDGFNWASELSAVTDQEVKNAIQANGLRLVNFSSFKEY